MKDIVTKLTSLKSEIAKANNGGMIQGFYWRLESLISKTFGGTSLYLKMLKGIDYIDHDTSLDKNKGKLMGLVDTILDNIDDSEEIISVTTSPRNSKSNNSQALNKKVFIVHGHNQIMKQSVARFIEKIGLEAIILHEQPNNGLTIIEKFQNNSNVGFAIVLLSGDDIGYSKKEGNISAKERARQNVIFELGYFTGSIGRDRVIALVENLANFEIPSDYSGILYIDFDTDSEKWRSAIAKELVSKDYPIDLTKVL